MTDLSGPTTGETAGTDSIPPRPQQAAADQRTRSSRHVLLVARREVRSLLLSRAFVISLAAMVLLVFGGFGLSQLFPEGGLRIGLVGEQPAGAVDTLVAVGEQEVADFTVVELGSSLPSAVEAVVDDGVEGEQERLLALFDQEALDAIVVDGAEVVVVDRDDSTVGLIAAAFTEARLIQGLEEADVAPGVVSEALTPLTVTQLDPDDEERSVREATSFIAGIILFLSIQINGAYIMMGIMEEKGTKIVELLLSSINPRDLLVGKVLGIGLVGLVQLVILTVAVLVAVTVFGGSLPTLSPLMFVFGLIWFLVGFVFYGSLFAAGASLAPRQEDAQATLAPVSIIIVFSYFISTALAVAPDSVASRVVSFVPSVAPFSSPGRLATGDIPIWESLLSLGVSIGAAALVFTLAARVYVRSVLHTDRKLGWLEAWRLED